MSLIIPANSLSGGYAVDNSCRFDTNAGMNKTAANGTRTKATFSTWVKRSNITAEQFLFVSYIDASNFILFRFTGAEQLEMVNRISASNISFYTTNALYRDPSAWYHIVWSLDSTQGTAGNRIKLFVNGTQVTSFATSTTQSADTNFAANVDTAEYYVAQEYTSGYNYFNGYLAETVWIDGLALAADQFGEFDADSGIWKPIDVSGLTFGTSGFYLDFEDSANLGNDANGGTDFTENNLTAIDQSTDTPTLNYPTANPNMTSTSNVVLSEGNLKVASNYASGWQSAGTTFAVKSGKWYWEAKATVVAASDKTSIGVIQFDTTQVDFIGNANLDLIAVNTAGITGHGAGVGSYSYAQGDIIIVAMDITNNKIYYGKNGTWFGTLDPANGSGSTTQTVDNNNYCMPVFCGYGGSTWEINFGYPAFTISSGNADANGYGNFEYAVPSGFFALNSANLAEYG